MTQRRIRWSLRKCEVTGSCLELIINKGTPFRITSPDSSRIGIGIDLGGTQVKGACFDLDSRELLAKSIVPTRDGELIAGKPAFVAQVEYLICELGGDSAEHIGISAPGVVNQDGKSIKFMPGRLSGLEHLNWSDVIGRPVVVLNDAQAALIGERWQGSARNLNDVILLTLGTSVGGAVISGGRLLKGHNGRAGHLGHIPINYNASRSETGMPGSLACLIGNHNIVERTNGHYQSTHELIDAVRAGDEFAEKVWSESIRALAAGIAGLTNVFDPEAVIIGGGISEAWDEIETRLADFLDQYEWRPEGSGIKVIKAGLGEWAGVYGALANAMDENVGS